MSGPCKVVTYLEGFTFSRRNRVTVGGVRDLQLTGVLLSGTQKRPSGLGTHFPPANPPCGVPGSTGPPLLIPVRPKLKNFDRLGGKCTPELTPRCQQLR